MYRAVYSVRPFVDADYEAEVRTDREINPQTPHTADEVRHYTEALMAEPGRISLRLAVEERRSGAVIAYGALQHTSFNYHPKKFWISVSVDPDHQRRGIGQELYSLLELEAVNRDAMCIWTSARGDDPGSTRFLNRQPFVEHRKVWQSRLDLVTADLSALPDLSSALSRQGIRITTIAAEGAERPEVRDRLYRLSLVASADVPRLGDYTPVSFEEFAAYDLESPGALPEGTFIAIHGEVFVGMTSLERALAQPDTLQVGFTGTLPLFRGRGIASELKRRALEYARNRGSRFLVTYNDSLNRRIWAINERLGFRPETTRVQAEKVLT